METIVVNKLRKIASTLKKLAMAASTYQVVYTKPSNISLINKRGLSYSFNDYDPSDERSFKNWLEEEIKNKEHLSENAIDDITIEVFSEIKQGKTNFSVKFFNIDIKTPELVY